MNSFVVGAVDVAAFMLCATFLAYVTLIPPPGEPPEPIVAVGTLRIAAASVTPRRHRPGNRAVVVGGRLKAAPPPALVVAGPGGSDVGH